MGWSDSCGAGCAWLAGLVLYLMDEVQPVAVYQHLASILWLVCRHEGSRCAQLLRHLPCGSGLGMGSGPDLPTLQLWLGLCRAWRACC